MVWRSAIGALAVVAVMAAVAAALPERPAGTSLTAAKEPAFGQLAKPQFTAADDGGLGGGAVAAQAAERSDLLKLASYAVPPVRRPVPTAAPPSRPDAGEPPTSSTEVSTSTAVSATGTTLGFAPAPSNLPAADAVNAEAMPPPPKAETKPRVASAEAPSPEESGPSRSNRLVNINRAPVAALDHLPGAGRIGQAIARRRPYRTVGDLVRKRVLRAGVFNRIKGSITVD